MRRAARVLLYLSCSVAVRGTAPVAAPRPGFPFAAAETRHWPAPRASGITRPADDLADF
jgi:hypothetical protein